MNNIAKTIVLLAMFGIPGSYAMADHAPRQYHQDAAVHFRNQIDEQQFHQQQRIRQGLRTGALSDREMRKLNREQHKFTRNLRRYERDWYFSGYERHQLQRDLYFIGKMIDELIHNKGGYARASKKEYAARRPDPYARYAGHNFRH